MLISIDGIDGCGKSTQVRLLADRIGAERIQEISPSRWGRRLRATGQPSLAQQLAWFTADRASLAEKLEAAAGSPTTHLVSDRSYLSGIAYQSYDSGLAPRFLEEMNLAIVPPYDLQVFLHVPVETALARIAARGDATTWCENAGLLTWACRVFEVWAVRRKQVRQIDGARPVEEVARSVLAEAERVARETFGELPWAPASGV